MHFRTPRSCHRGEVHQRIIPICLCLSVFDAGTVGPSHGVEGASLLSRLVVIFVVFIPLAFSEDFLEAAYETARRPQPRWAVLAVDAVLLALIWAPSLRRRPSGTGKARDPGFLPGWWAVGAVLMLAVDGTVAWILPEGLGVYLGTSLLYIVSLAFILAAIIGADPVRMLFQQRHAEVRPAREAQEAWERFRPAVPLLLGTLAAYVGSQLWGFLLDSGPLRTMEGAQAAAVSQGLIGQGAGLTAAEEAAVIDRLCTGGSTRSTSLSSVRSFRCC